MPTFCRHSRLIQNCPICAREQAIELRPVISSSAPGSAGRGPSAPRQPRRGPGSPRPVARQRTAAGLTVRRLARGVDDGFRCALVPGLRSSQDTERLATEIAFATTRLRMLEIDPPGLYAEVADGDRDREERTWLAFLIAYLCPTDSADPFSAIEAVRTHWSDDRLPALEGVETGPRSAHDPARGGRTLEAYRGWAARPGSQAAAFIGEAAWNPERRFARTFERLALPGMHRAARYDLLVTLGTLGVYQLRPNSLQFGRGDEVTVAAKRALGIGDQLLLERRAAELAHVAQVPLEALDLALYNWERGERATLGVPPQAGPDTHALASARAALGL